MDHSMAPSMGAARSVDLPGWKTIASHVAALIITVLFVTAGVWKIIDPFTWRTMVEQLKVPYALSMPLTIALGISETFAGVAILVPRFRRWGAGLAILLLIVFMLYIGVNYSTLAGKECSCFPWAKRTVSPEFFVGDLLMLAAAWIAARWGQRSSGLRSAAVMLGAIAVFSAASFGVNAARQTGTRAPDSIVVDGQPFSLQHGRVFLFFYDPQCSHCEKAARDMSKLNWGETKVIAIPTAEPRYAASFLHDTALKAGTSLELEPLKKVFPFKSDPPYGVALENGRETGAIARYEGNEPEATLRKLGLIQ